MGFLLFAARKLQLKREINNKNYELMVLTSQYNQAQKRVAQFQEQMENAKNMTSVFAQCLQNAATNGRYQEYINSNLNSDNADNKKLAENLQNWLNGDRTTAFTPEQQSQVTMLQQQATQIGTATASVFTTMTDSIFTAANKVQLAQLKAQENSLELRKSSLESEVALLDEEYKAVKSKEGEAIKDAVPQFGLA